MIQNEAAFQKSLDEFVKFDKSGRLKKEELDYKERLISVLGEALSDESLSSSDFLPELREAARQVSNEIINLTHYIVFDDFKKYLKAVPQERFVPMLRGLFDEGLDLASRFDSFDSELNKDYDTYIAPKRRSGWLTALLLSARYPGSCVFYRASPINFAQETWGIDIDISGTRGKRYVAFLEAMGKVRERLTPALRREADLLDAHSFLWVEYNEHKRKTHVTEGDKVKFWKIAPGPDAKYWKMCRDQECIVVHWISDVDFRKYPDQKAIRNALREAGQKGGGTTQIWWFTHEMKPEDIVVTNQGSDTVVGIGKTKVNHFIELNFPYKKPLF